MDNYHANEIARQIRRSYMTKEERDAEDKFNGFCILAFAGLFILGFAYHYLAAHFPQINVYAHMVINYLSGVFK